jgi:xanthine dehydrogenase small subunit
LVAGATDVGLWITKQLRQLDKIILLSRVAGLGAIAETEDSIAIGATATYAQAQQLLARIDPDIAELLRRLGSTQVRASGTIGGNIANGSPIGDTPPMLIALGATLELQNGSHRRRLPLEDFFIAYGRQDRQPGEFVAGIYIPKLKPEERFRCYKISKRIDQDISSVMAAFKFTIADNHIAASRIAFGGMAGTPKRAPLTEAALRSAKLDDQASWQAALDALARDYAPIADHRASAAYRSETARALLQKALMELAGETATRVIGGRDRAA